ncbi:MAG: hypothetical protein J5689_03340, partial [Clostridia bacterium]|nr:hypothetical protein [Clostridia bacterium]
DEIFTFGLNNVANDEFLGIVQSTVITADNENKGVGEENVLNSSKTDKTEFGAIDGTLGYVLPSDYTRDNMLFAFVYSIPGEDGAHAYYYAKFSNPTSSNYWEKYGVYYYLTRVLEVNVVTSDLNKLFYQDMYALGIIKIEAPITSDSDWWKLKNYGVYSSKYKDKDEYNSIGLKSDSDLDTELLNSSGLHLDGLAETSPAVQIAYNTWSFPRRFDDFSETFDATVVKSSKLYTNGSGSERTVYKINNAAKTWGRFDGGTMVGLNAIKEEYYAMADFIDFAVESNMKFYFVNSQNPLIDFENSGLSTDYWKKNETTGLYEFVVNYDGVGEVLYTPSNAQTELEGALYLICYENANGRYIPVVSGVQISQYGYSDAAYSSMAYGANGQLLIARGFFDFVSNKNEPTYITEIKLDSSGNETEAGEIKYITATADNESSLTTNMVTPSTMPVAKFVAGDSAVDSNSFVKSGEYSYSDYFLKESNLNSSAGYYSYIVNPKSAIYNQNLFNQGSEITKNVIFRAEPLENTLGISSRDNNITYSGGVYSCNFNATQNGSPVTYTIEVSYGANTYAGVKIKNNGNYLSRNSNSYEIESVLTVCTNLVPVYSESFQPIDNTLTYVNYSMNNNLNVSAISNLINPSSGATIGDLKTSSSEYSQYQLLIEGDEAASLYIYNQTNKIVIINYQNVKFGTSETKVSTKDLTNIAGYNSSKDEAVINYKNALFKFRCYSTNDAPGVYSYYVTEATELSVLRLKLDFYDGYSYYDANGDIKTLSKKEADANPVYSQYVNVLIVPVGSEVENSTFYKLYDKNGNVSYSVNATQSGKSSFKVYIYENGSLRAQFTATNSNSSFAKYGDLKHIMANLNTGAADGGWKTAGVWVDSQKLLPLPKLNPEEIVGFYKPAKIVTKLDKLSKSIFTMDFNVFNPSGSRSTFAWRFHPALFSYATAKPYDVKVFTLKNQGAFSLDYGFDGKDAIGLRYLYMASDINVIVLVLGTIVIFNVLMQSMWGLIKRVYDIVILFIVMPGFAATIPIDDGGRFAKWKDKVISSIFSAYGVLVGLNLFFVLVPAIDSATGNLFVASDLPETVSRTIFGTSVGIAYLNKLVSLLFTLVALTLIKTLPAYFSKLTGFGDAYFDGGKTVSKVKEVLKEGGDTISGRNAKDFIDNSILGKDEKGNAHPFTKGMLSNFIPGSALIGGAVNDLRQRAAAKYKPPEVDKEKEEEKPQTTTTQSDPLGNPGEKQTTTQTSSGGTTFGGTQNNEPIEVNGTNDKNDWVEKSTEGLKGKELFETNVQNAMADVDKNGEFNATLEQVNSMKGMLGSEFTEFASKTGAKDENGNDIWSVKVGKIGADEAKYSEQEAKTGATMEAAANKMAAYDTQIADLKGKQSGFDASEQMAIKETQDAYDALSGAIDINRYSEFQNLTSENERKTRALSGVETKVSDLHSQNDAARIKLDEGRQLVKNLEAAYMLQTDKNSDTAKSIYKQLQDARDGVRTTEAGINNRNEDIKKYTDQRDKWKDEIKSNNAQIASMSNGKSVSEVNTLVERYSNAKNHQRNISEASSANKAEISKLENQRKIAENSYNNSKNNQEIAQQKRDGIVGSRYEEASKKATSEYEAAVKRQN